jgi:hypothetical protein
LSSQRYFKALLLRVLQCVFDGLFPEVIEPVVAVGVSRWRMGRELPTLIPVAGNHFRDKDQRSRLFRLGLEDEPIRQALFGFVSRPLLQLEAQSRRESLRTNENGCPLGNRVAGQGSDRKLDAHQGVPAEMAYCLCRLLRRTGSTEAGAIPTAILT